jgi:hypothetical protein
MAQLLHEDSLPLATSSSTHLSLSTFISEENSEKVLEIGLSQSSPKNVILCAIEVSRLFILGRGIIKDGDHIAEKLKKAMIETFVCGKDHEIRVKTVEIIQMFLSEWRGYFRKFSEIFKTTD